MAIRFAHLRFMLRNQLPTNLNVIFIENGSFMSDELKHYYLQAMGIDLWKLRQSNSCQKDLSSLAKEVASCTRCPLHKTRTQTVFYRGDEKAKLMIIGEAPGFYEDQQGLPFVGKAGGLLNQMLQSVEMAEKDVYIANVLKCRPPNNRDPHLDEIAQCSSFLVRQIELIKPYLILALGRFAGQFLLNKPLSLKQLRNTIHYYNDIPFIVSYHPAYLLRNPADKKKTYTDLLTVKKLLTEKMS
ncbi:C-terminal part of DNA polymerase, bacteriophage-type [Legionella sainthelensi]|nr:C-terminal part of DNA polymerase, bacteriophage-type [Legionella sainthelensi]